jgi:hypothetical protein
LQSSTLAAQHISQHLGSRHARNWLMYTLAQLGLEIHCLDCRAVRRP